MESNTLIWPKAAVEKTSTLYSLIQLSWFLCHFVMKLEIEEILAHSKNSPSAAHLMVKLEPHRGFTLSSY